MERYGNSNNIICPRKKEKKERKKWGGGEKLYVDLSLNISKDLYEVYGERLDFLPKSFGNTTVFRVTSNVITSQVAGGIIKGMFGSSADVPVLQQYDSIDSLRPGYSCGYADNLRGTYQGNNPDWTEHLEQSQQLFSKLDAISGISPSDSGWHS